MICQSKYKMMGCDNQALFIIEGQLITKHNCCKECLFAWINNVGWGGKITLERIRERVHKNPHETAGS